MAADDVRALLDETLAAHQTTRGMRVSMGWTCACGWWSPDQSPPLILAHQADALLPVVERIAREAAGKALRDAADDMHLDPLLRSADFASYVTHKLRARAETADGGEGR